MLCRGKTLEYWVSFDLLSLIRPFDNLELSVCLQGCECALNMTDIDSLIVKRVQSYIALYHTFYISVKPHFSA